MATAFYRLLLLLKTGKIGDVVSVDATCTSLKADDTEDRGEWDGIYEWGPTALLPVFQILGPEYTGKQVFARFSDAEKKHDSFVKMDFTYPAAIASVKVGNGVKSEGELIVSGTRGYVYVPAPVEDRLFRDRFEDHLENKRCFYQLDRRGIRYELVAFVKAMEGDFGHCYIGQDVSRAIALLHGRVYGKEEHYLYLSRNACR